MGSLFLEDRVELRDVKEDELFLIGSVTEGFGGQRLVTDSYLLCSVLQRNFGFRAEFILSEIIGGASDTDSFWGHRFAWQKATPVWALTEMEALAWASSK